MKRNTPRSTMLVGAILVGIAGIAIAAPQATPAAVTSKANAAQNTTASGQHDHRDAKGGNFHRGHRGMRGMHGGIERLDKDGDGRISRAEFDAAKAAREARMAKAGHPAMKTAKPHAFDFAAADTNRDGYLVRSEMRAYHERMRPQFEAQRAQRAEERFQAADINKDGKLSKLEVSEKMPRLAKSFAWMDENRDGFLSRAELAPRSRR